MNLKGKGKKRYFVIVVLVLLAGGWGVADVERASPAVSDADCP